MRKIIPLLVLILMSALITQAQKLSQADGKAAMSSVVSNREAIGISVEQLNNAVVATSYEDVSTGVRYVGLQQTYRGIPVYNQVLVLAFKNDKLVSRAGFFDPSIEKAVNVASASPAISAESAVQSALSDRGLRASQMAIAINRKDNGRQVEFGNMGVSQENITASLTWVPNETTKQYSLAWQVYIIPKTTSDYWMVRVDAVNNSILGMDNYTDYDHWGNPLEQSNMRYPGFDFGTISKENDKVLFDFKKTDDPNLVTTATYRVVPFPAESPLHPGGAPATRTDPWTAATANATTLRWHTGAASTDYDYTRGNNVFAYHDRPNDNTGTPAEAATSTTAFPNLTFDFVPDFTLEPVVTSPPNQQWNITNLFYWNNIIHDVLYAYGFTEAGRNFQDDNLGRGGAGADWVRAEAQDGGGTNNANFSTPADGSLPRMQMYLWTAPTPDRDGDVDNGIIIHEYGHGVSNRSNAGGVGCLGNAEQGGEGWSDYLGLMLTQDWSTATINTGFNSPRGIGTYALNQPNNGPGIRPQRYCTDFAVNNATYATLPGQAIPHGVGWVWCTMLWEMTWELINHIGTITPNLYNTAGTGGNIVAMKLVMEGLRLQQCQPGFVSARNAILRADTVLFGGIYYCPIMRAFARRGVGVGALEGSTSSINDQTPSFVGGGPTMSFTQNGAAGIPELGNIIYNHSITAACSAITNYTLRDTLPTNVTFVSATNGGVYTPATRVVAWPVNIALNATQNYGLTVQINAGSYFPPVQIINEVVPSTTISGFWTTTSTPAGTPWIAHNVRSHSAPNSFFTPNLATVSDQVIATTNSFALGATPPVLSFWHWYNSEASWDGGVLEISTNGGASWGDIGAANFTQNGYNGALNASANPLGGRAAWNGNSSAFIETKVNMTPYANQANVKLRWRFGSDASLNVTGWNVDDILLETRAVVNLRTSLFNASNVRVEIRDTVTIILPPNAIPPTVTINQAASQADPTSVSPINFTVVFDQAVTGFTTGDVVITGTANATTGTVTGSGTTYNVAVSGMTNSGTVIATIPAGVAINSAGDPNVASTSTDNTVTYQAATPPGCITTVSFTGPPVAIPDDNAAGVNIPITVSGVGTIADLNFRLDPGAGTCDATAGNTNSSVDHTFNSDLIFTLTSPNATTVTLINRRGGDGNNFCLVTLDDDGSFPSPLTMPTTGAISGNYSPESPLSVFDGQNANGTWTLNVSDNAAIDIGFVRGFSLIFTSVQATIAQRGNDTLCAGATAGPYNFTSSPAGATISWTNSNTAIGLGASGTGNIPAFTTTNPGATPITGIITVTPTIGTCPGIPMVFRITVLPAPTVNAIPNQVLCQNQPTAPVNFTGSPAGVVFQWTNNNTLIGLAASGTGNIPSFIALNPTQVQQVATITVTPVTGLNNPITQTFNFTGAVQTFTVPAGITSINIKSWGAQGNSNAGGILGGLGGYAEGNLAVTPGQVLNVMVGGGGTQTVNGGFNGGGAAGANPGCASALGGGGGGASDVRVAPYALANRVIVGAGGGGAGGNRTAGCGRGAGGGGGAGLWGGGGGAGWPGVPPGGPVPTGGTQSAGGAGGVTTWTAGGPTNGTAGGLGVGGVGGNEVASAQGTPTGPAEPGGNGGGLTGASGNYNPANNWNGQSGAGGSSYIGGVTSGITNAGVRSGAGQVQITYQPPSATTCFGTPRTFTITVNPNANLIIVADPGTTLCEGDPTLLTVHDAGAVVGPTTLYNQTGTQINGSPSQVFEPANAAFDSQAADDFNVPAGGNWTITGITANGIGTGAPTSVNVFFYQNAANNLPGTAIASFTNITTFTRTGGNYTVTLPSGVALGAGRYWMSFQVNMSFATSGQWFWGNYGAPVVNSEYAWRNPGGGFATPCTNWGYGGTGCNVGGGAANVNNIFSIIGTTVGIGPQSTGTFLWTPAAGLSSTTSNPVAASPQNTTTYTVTRTTVPGGCVASASITITVNKRPVVTTHPVSRTNCAGTSATFTVAGTGTNLAYQWQVSPTGCAGPWTNLTNTGAYSGVNTATLTVNPVSVLMTGYAYRVILTGTCAPWTPPTNVSNCAVLTVNPLPNITVTPPVSCGGIAGINGTALTVTSGPPPVPGQVTVNSGAINVPIPDGSNVAATHNLTVAGIPANATITEVKVNVNVNHTWVGDVDINLRAPTTTAILNLVGSLDNGAGGNTTDNFTNTTFSSLGGLTISGAPAPRTGVFAAEARAGSGPIGFIQTVTNWGALYPTAASANGQWTIALGDNVAIDAGTLTNWSITIDYTTPGAGGNPVLNYVWSPLAGLYTDPTASTAYTGTNLSTVYAAPTVQTLYTVTATNPATGCVSTGTALVNYTPPAPTLTPNPVSMCLGDPAVLVRSSSSTSGTNTFSSGTINLNIPDGPTIPPVPTSYPAVSSNITVSGIPANATVTAVRARFNVTHAWVSDLVMALKAPNGQIVNLDALINRTNQAGANFVNTVISSASTTPLGGAAPYTGTYADDAAGATFTALGFTWPGGPTGFIPTTNQFTNLFTNGASANGVWSVGMYDAGAPDGGTWNNWSIDIDWTLGVPASPAVWSPVTGLYTNAAATTPYVAGTPIDSVWVRPTPAGVYTYTATVNNVIATNSTINTPMSGGNGNNLVAFNVRNNNLIPVTFSSISSNTFGSGAVVSRVFYKTTPIAGAPGAITAANGWNQFGTANNNVTAGTLNPLMSGLTLVIPPGATYGIALDMTGATFPAYTNGSGTIQTYSSGGVDLITDGNVGWGGPAAPGVPVNNPRNFNGSITLTGSGPGNCTSPARTLTVTVNNPTTVVTQPVAQTVCTDKVATFTVVPGGSGPFSYQWQVSTNGNNPPWTNVTNGGVYSGATSSTLTITAPPVSMNGNFYRVVITGAAPCAPAISNGVRLTVNPLPVVVISASPYTALFPGLRTMLTSTVSPNAAASYTWLRNGIAVPGGINSSLEVDVDGLGDYTLRVTDVNGCTNTSNLLTIRDSVSAKCFIYPNPTSGIFQVRYYSVANNVLPRTLTIYDAKGDRVFTKMYTIGRPYDRMDVDMRAYGKGLYWVEIGDRNGNRLTMCRVVIQ